jgi:hypothetical protein
LPLIIRLSWYSVHLACCWNMLGRIILMGWNNTHTHIYILYIYICMLYIYVILYHIIIINYLSIIYIYTYEIIWRYIHTWAIDSILLFSLFQLRIHISQVRPRHKSATKDGKLPAKTPKIHDLPERAGTTYGWPTTVPPRRSHQWSHRKVAVAKSWCCDSIFITFHASP